MITSTDSLSHTRWNHIPESKEPIHQIWELCQSKQADAPGESDKVAELYKLIDQFHPDLQQRGPDGLTAYEHAVQRDSGRMLYLVAYHGGLPLSGDDQLSQLRHHTYFGKHLETILKVLDLPWILQNASQAAHEFEYITQYLLEKGQPELADKILQSLLEYQKTGFHQCSDHLFDRALEKAATGGHEASVNYLCRYAPNITGSGVAEAFKTVIDQSFPGCVTPLMLLARCKPEAAQIIEMAENLATERLAYKRRVNTMEPTVASFDHRDYDVTGAKLVKDQISALKI